MAQLLKALADEYGGKFRAEVLSFEDNLPKPFILIRANGRDVRFLKGVETELKDGDEVSFFTAVGGG